MSHLRFSILAFSTNFWPITHNWPVFLTANVFGIFNELLATQNVNVARFARKVEWDFFCDFQTLTVVKIIQKSRIFTMFIQPDLR